ncbi:MAG TPA: PLP-dependent aminotransferase family protein [Geminicoccaceae bacterium]|nr:PLP-dependent aminotransferase family protein [Geminicoccaceae bacterium]
MTMWAPGLAGRPGPRYRALVEALAQDIGDGRLPAGTRLPPQRELAYRLGVTVGTVSRAYALAAQRGLVSGEVGRGTFVRDATAPVDRASRASDGAGDAIKLTINAPPDPCYRAVLGERLAALAAGSGAAFDLWGYTPKPGLLEHRAAGARWIGGVGVPAAPERTLLTGGAHQAIVVAFAALARSGDRVLIEALAYSGVCHVAERCGVRLHGLAMDDEGLLPEALAAACRADGARLLFVNPTAHNPTTATMSIARREAIVALARRHDLIVIEDDVYGRLPEERLPPLAALAPERTVYIGSASKSVAPGLRLGVLLCPPQLVQRLADAQHDLFLTCPPLMAELFTQLVRDGTAEQLAARQRQEAMVRQLIAREVLGARAHVAQPTSYHLWLPLPPPWRTAEFIEHVGERGVMVDPATAFAVDRARAPHAVRVSLSAAANHDRLRRGLQVLAEALGEMPARPREVI